MSALNRGYAQFLNVKRNSQQQMDMVVLGEQYSLHKSFYSVLIMTTKKNMFVNNHEHSVSQAVVALCPEIIK
jgi:hypothetical protein